MNKRIKELRKKYLNLTQVEFGKRLGMKGNSISDIENAKNGVSETLIKLICSEFRVNEEWLRNGNGNVFNRYNEESLLYQALSEYNLNNFQKKMVERFLKLKEAQRVAIIKYIKTLIDSSQKFVSDYNDLEEKVQKDEKTNTD